MINDSPSLASGVNYLFLMLQRIEGKLDAQGQQQEVLKTEMSLLKQAVVGNGTPGINDRLLHVETEQHAMKSRQDQHDGVFGFWKWGAPLSLTIIGTAIAIITLVARC